MKGRHKTAGCELVVDLWYPAVGVVNIATKCWEPVLGMMNGSQLLVVKM